MAISKMPPSVDVGSWNPWTGKATDCLIGQYKKYRSMIGQSSQIQTSTGDVRDDIVGDAESRLPLEPAEMREQVARALEPKYKNLVFHGTGEKAGQRMRHYGQWEHKRALDEILGEKKRHVYPEANDPPGGESAVEKSPLPIAPRANSDEIAPNAGAGIPRSARLGSEKQTSES